MYVGVATFELHIEHAQSLKEKRMVVRSLRDRVRHRFEVSIAEVALQDLHQRARMAVAIVSGDHITVERTLEAILDLVENEAEARVVGWSPEIIQFDEATVPLDIPNIPWSEDDGV
ncbi:MAG TPA: DUF503 domain-containing protein [Thermoanaerobaculia bacterium]|nr:DUF503 domain-containing protein [Thermoanaerobaculia bacterium]